MEGDNKTSIIARTTRVVALRSTDQDNDDKWVSVSFSDTSVNKTWKCTDEYPGSGWFDIQFDDSNWKQASVRTDISNGISSYIITLGVTDGSKKTTYCRMHLGEFTRCPCRREDQIIRRLSLGRKNN